MLREIDFAASDAACLGATKMHPRFYCAHVAIFYERQAVASDCSRAWVAADRWHRLDKEGLRLPARP
jgi:hypothetical protein